MPMDAARASLFRGPCLIDCKGPSAGFLAIQLSHRLFRLDIICHGDEGKTTRPSGNRISDNLGALNGSIRLEDRLQLGVCQAERKIADIKCFHSRSSGFEMWLFSAGWAGTD